MKLHLAVIMSLFFLNACDAPQKTRYMSAAQGNKVEEPKATDGLVDPGTTTGTTTGGATDSEALQAGFESCNTTPSFYNAGIGYMSICQHASIKAKIRVGFTTTDQTVGTCFIPLFKDGSGNSTYLGSPQCTKHNDKDVMYGDLANTRSGYTQYPINGVMVLKYNSTTAFYQCMNAYTTSFNACAPQCYGNSYCMGSCQSNATNYMNQLCNTFKTNNAYIDVKF